MPNNVVLNKHPCGICNPHPGSHPHSCPPVEPPSIDGKRKCDFYTKHHKRGKYYLKQSDFENGTYRIRRPGYYRICEDIVFEPRKHFDHEPERTDPLYSGPGYQLGFFAAITVECEHVTLDLGGHTIRQSELHALQQAFYAHIELANVPFIPPQGPAAFGPITSAHDVAIVNGVLGLSSHHGVHGNGMTKTLFKDLIIKDFEVAAIHLNGGGDHTICNIRAGPSRQDKPVMGTWSAGRFIRSFLRAAAKELPDSKLRDKAGILLRHLQANMDRAKHQILCSGMTSDPLWHNPHRTTDGNVYGIVFNPLGVAVAGLQAKEPAEFVRDVKVKNVEIFGLRAEIDEVIGISQPDGTGVQNDTAGALFRIDEWCDPKTGKYVPNPLADAMLFLAANAADISFIGKLNITQDVVNWSKGKITKKELLKLQDYQYKCNGDTMFHVNKGIIPLRIDGVKGGIFKSVYIHDICNLARMGNHILCGAYEKSHDQQSQIGYSGGDVKTISVNYSRDLCFKKIKIDGIRSLNGIASGFDIAFHSKHIDIKCSKIGSIRAGTRKCCKWLGLNYYGKFMPYGKLPNLEPQSFGVKISPDSKKVHCDDVKIDKKALISPGPAKAKAIVDSTI